jgi:hypothetical protein
MESMIDSSEESLIDIEFDYQQWLQYNMNFIDPNQSPASEFSLQGLHATDQTA